MAVGVVLAATALAAPDLEVRLAAALHREMVLGDLRGALAEYRAIAGEPGGTKSTMARALLQMAQVQGKLGQRKDARATYERIANEFGDQGEAVEARARLADWVESLPGPRNLSFEDGVPGKVPPGWFVPALPKDADRLAEIRRDGCRSGGGCALVSVPANAPNPVGQLMQSFSAAAYRGRTVRLRAWLRLEASAPDDRAQIWLSVDRANRQPGFFVNDESVRSAEWIRHEIVSHIGDDVTFINFGIMSLGRGRVWVDDVSLEAITGSTAERP